MLVCPRLKFHSRADFRMTDAKVGDYNFAAARDKSSSWPKRPAHATIATHSHKVMPILILCGGLGLTIMWVSLLGYGLVSLVGDIPIW